MRDTTNNKITRRQEYLQTVLAYRHHPFFQVTATSFLSLFLLTVFAVFAIQPTIVKITGLQKEIEQDQEILDQLTTKSKNLKIIAARWEEISPKMPALTMATPLGPKYQDFHKKIANLAYDNRVSLASVNTNAVVMYTLLGDPYLNNPKASVVQLPITMRIVGDYPNLVMFLKELALMDRVVEFENVSIVPEIASGSEKKQIAMNVSGNIYYLADTSILNKLIDIDKSSKDKNVIPE